MPEYPAPAQSMSSTTTPSGARKSVRATFDSLYGRRCRQRDFRTEVPLQTWSHGALRLASGASGRQISSFRRKPESSVFFGRSRSFAPDYLRGAILPSLTEQELDSGFRRNDEQR